MGLLIAALLGLPPAPTAAEDPAAPQVVLMSFDELQRRLAEPHLRVIDVRPRGEYERGHVPGAVWWDVKAAEELAAKPGGLDDARAWSRRIAPLGIGLEMSIVVYDANRQLDAARVWWLLRYLGFDHVGLVDGGYGLWTKQGRPTSVEVPAVVARRTEIQTRRDRLAMRDDVLATIRATGAARVIDARSREEHIGAVAKSKRGGRIPTACHLEWTQLVDADGCFLDEPALRRRLAKAGIQPGEAVITHCQGGGRASVDAFVFERLGFPTRNYYLGWSDWGNADETPVDAP